jgi:hypothetical protein
MRTTYEIVTQEAIDSFDIADNIWLKGLTHEYIGNLVAFGEYQEFQKYIEHCIDPDTFDINNYSNKKCFVIPGCSRTHARVKDMMKDLDIKIVKDYNDADFFISNTSINIKISKNNVFFDLYSNYMNVGWYDNRNILDAFYSNITNSGAYNKKVRRYMIGGLYFNLRQTGKDFVPIHHFTDLCQDVVLDEDMKDYLVGMIKSTNTDDYNVVKKILPKIDISSNQLVLFKLFDECLYKYRNSFERDKDARNWIKESGVYDWYHSPSFIIEQYHKRGVLTNEGFKYLELKNREDVSIQGGSIYNFKVSLKEEYKKYLK